MILLPLVAIIGVARSLSSIVTVWNDRVLCLAAGWRRIPDETTFGRILPTFTQRNIMVLCSGNKILRRWEAATIRTFLIRMAGKWTTGSRQQKLRVPKRMLYNAQWEAGVAVAEMT